MTSETIARNYAETLFELGRRHEALEAFGRGLDMVGGLLEEDPSLKVFLETPRVPDYDKKKVLRKVFTGVLPPPLLTFLLLLVDKRRQRLLGEIIREFQVLLDKQLGRTHVSVILAQDLGAEAMGELAAKLSRLLGKQVIPHVQIRPAILGGVYLKVGDTVYDATLRGRLKRMRQRLLSKPILPAVSGA